MMTGHHPLFLSVCVWWSLVLFPNHSSSLISYQVRIFCYQCDVRVSHAISFGCWTLSQNEKLLILFRKSTRQEWIKNMVFMLLLRPSIAQEQIHARFCSQWIDQRQLHTLLSHPNHDGCLALATYKINNVSLFWTRGLGELFVKMSYFFPCYWEYNDHYFMLSFLMLLIKWSFPFCII